MLPPSSPTAEPDARRRDARRNERRIVTAATRVLADDPEATMQDVADAAGLGRATVYRHFPTREELTQAIELAAITELGEVLAEAHLDQGDPVEALRRAIGLVFEVGDRYRVVAREARAGPTPDKRRLAESAFRPIAALLERGRREGALAGDVPPRWVTAAVGALIGAAFRQIEAGTLARADAPRVVMDTILGGLAPRA